MSLLAVLSAILLSLSFPQYSLSFLAWFCLAPLLYVLRHTGFFTAALLGFLFGYFFGLTAFSWFVAMGPTGYFQWLVLFIPVLSLYYLVFGAAYNLCARYLGGWVILAAPCLWAGLEYVRSNLFFLASSGNLLGHTQYLQPLIIQHADITGVYGISFLILLVNQFISEIPDFIFNRRNLAGSSMQKKMPAAMYAWHVLLVFACLLAALFYGYARMSPPATGNSIRVAMVQGNVLIKDNMDFQEQAEYLQVYNNLTMEASVGEPDLIVWPSSSLPAPIRSSRLVSFALKKISRETGAHLMVGGAGQEKFSTKKNGKRPYANSEFLVSPAGEILAQYNKMILLPFNEYLPLQGTFTWPGWITTLRESFTAGSEYTLFQVAGAVFGVPICWENYFSNHFRRFVKNGANFMISASNDAFYGRNSGPYQALANNIFRAVENRVTVARISSTGVSCIIEQNGVISGMIRDQSGDDLFVPGVLVKDIPLLKQKTFYTLYGDVFSLVSVTAGIFFVAAALYLRKAKGK